MGLLVKPLPFTVVTQAPISGTSLANANNDEAGLVYRTGTQNDSIVVDLGTGASYDTIALIGTNLVSSDTVQFRGSTNGNSPYAFDSGAVAAFTGTKVGSKAISIYRSGSTLTSQRVRININSTAFTAGYTDVFRIVIGKSLPFNGMAGVDAVAEFGMYDQSVMTTGAGWSSFQNYGVLSEWKARISFIEESDWRASWAPFFKAVGTSSGFLFVPDPTDAASYQADAVYGRLLNQPKAEISAAGFRHAEITMRSIAA